MRQIVFKQQFHKREGGEKTSWDIYSLTSLRSVTAVIEQHSTGSTTACGLGGQEVSSVVAGAHTKDDAAVQQLRRLLLY